MKVLTQAEAVKRFGKSYKDYDPMIMVVGKPSEFRRGKLKMSVSLDDKLLISQPMKIDEFGSDTDSIQLDFAGKSQWRLVIWRSSAAACVARWDKWHERHDDSIS